MTTLEATYADDSRDILIDVTQRSSVLRAAVRAVVSVGLVSLMGGAFVSQAETVNQARIKSISIAADAVDEVEPGFAADCRFAYTLMAGFIDNIDDEVTRYRDFLGLDKAEALELADVWGLVLFRESTRENVDPMKVKGGFIKEITGSAHRVGSERRRRGSLSMAERQVRKCEAAAKAKEASK